MQGCLGMGVGEQMSEMDGHAVTIQQNLARATCVCVGGGGLCQNGQAWLNALACMEKL